jgi:hypothetical protein
MQSLLIFYNQQAAVGHDMWLELNGGSLLTASKIFPELDSVAILFLHFVRQI